MEGVTVVAVARRAGLNRSTAYQHFPKREDLLTAVAAEFVEAARRIFAAPRAFSEQIDFFVDYFFEHPDIARIWIFRLLTGHAESSPGWTDYVTAVERFARNPKTREGIDAEMLGVIGLGSALFWSLIARGRDRSERDAREATDRFARELKRLTLFGVLHPESWPEMVAELAEK